MLCFVVLCRIVSCCVVLCRVVSYCVVLCSIVSCCVVLCRVLSYCVVLCRVVSYCVVLCCIVSCCVVLCRVVFCRVVSYCVVFRQSNICFPLWLSPVLQLSRQRNDFVRNVFDLNFVFVFIVHSLSESFLKPVRCQRDIHLPRCSSEMQCFQILTYSEFVRQTVEAPSGVTSALNPSNFPFFYIFSAFGLTDI